MRRLALLSTFYLRQTNNEYYAHYNTHLKCYQQVYNRQFDRHWSEPWGDVIREKDRTTIGLLWSVPMIVSSIHMVKICNLLIDIILHSDERRE